MEGGYNDIDPGLNPALQDHYRITPSPGGPGDQYGTLVRSREYRSSSPPTPTLLANSRKIATVHVLCRSIFGSGSRGVDPVGSYNETFSHHVAARPGYLSARGHGAEHNSL